MSVNKSFYIGFIGMNANLVVMNMIGDNIVNMNIVGFKSGWVQF